MDLTTNLTIWPSKPIIIKNRKDGSFEMLALRCFLSPSLQWVKSMFITLGEDVADIKQKEPNSTLLAIPSKSLSSQTNAEDSGCSKNIGKK